MNFNARQYDPLIGRFLSIDPLAYVGGQQVHSPYAAMGNNPGMMIDPNGTRSKYANDPTEDGNLALLEYHYRNMLGGNRANNNSNFGMKGNSMFTFAGGGGGGSTLSGKNAYTYEMFKSLLSVGHKKLVSNSYRFGFLSFEISDAQIKEWGWTKTGVIHDGFTIEWDTPNGAACSGATPRIINEIIPFENIQQSNGGSFTKNVYEVFNTLSEGSSAVSTAAEGLGLANGLTKGLGFFANIVGPYTSYELNNMDYKNGIIDKNRYEFRNWKIAFSSGIGLYVSRGNPVAGYGAEKATGFLFDGIESAADYLNNWGNYIKNQMIFNIGNGGF